jgi:hypothetical protein
MRSITLHPNSSIRFTPYAAQVCQVLNAYKKANPNATFAEMTKWYNRNGYKISESSVARYYYGFHALNNRGSCNQVREGACVAI